MATRRRSRRKSISGNLTDIQKRIRYLETRPSAGRLASKAVATRNLALRAVEEDAVADNAIVRRSIASAAVGTAEIETDSITNALIATNAVNTDSIAPSSVTTDELATDSVTTDKIAPGAVTTGEIANDSINNDKIASNAVNSDSIAAGSVGTDELAFAAVTTDKIANEAVTDDKIDGISGSKIIGGIDGALIVANSITGGKLANDTITSTQLATDSVTDDALAPLSVGYSELKKDNVLSDNIFRNSIIGRAGTNPLNGVFHIQNFSIGSDDIFSGAITSNKIDALAVTTAKINDLAVTNAKVATGISPDKITGLSNAFTTMSVAGIGISRSLEVNGDYRRFDITISAGSGSNQLAIGSHQHAAGAVGAHTHNATLFMDSMAISGGAHGHGVGATGSHGHGVTPSGSVSVGAVVTSTLKLKKDISDFTVTDPKNILNLKIKKYKYKNSVRGIQNRYNREWMYGYIAEEVQELGVEQILAYDKNGDPDGIDYGLLSVLVLELVKVQQNEIDSLKEEIQRLKEVI
jgi:hypothetical protein